VGGNKKKGRKGFMHLAKGLTVLYSSSIEINTNEWILNECHKYKCSNIGQCEL
jgi:hypothetical protein